MVILKNIQTILARILFEYKDLIAIIVVSIFTLLTTVLNYIVKRTNKISNTDSHTNNKP